MLRIEKSSKLDQSKVMDRAVAFFGAGGLELEVKEHADCCARFEGGGGYVYVQVSPGEDGKGSHVEVEGREWEYDIRRFLTSI